MSPAADVDAAVLTDVAIVILEAVGVRAADARTVAVALVDADLEGIPSHGLMLLPMYVDRIRAGSIDVDTEPEMMVDRDAVVVFDAHHSLGQPTAELAMAEAVARAARHGVGVAGVRHAFHFGTARRYTLQAAAAGCVGIAMCNTRPLLPPPGGAERIVGNNPVSIAMPVSGSVPLVLDLAMSEAAMGKLRIADQAGTPIPEGWATDADGVPTIDPAAAIQGMLLPVGGHKGFGLAFMIDLLAGALSGGAWGDAVQPLYGDLTVPYDCSHLFLAIGVSHFRPVEDFADETARAAARVRGAKKAPEVTRIHTPGERGWERRRASDGVVSLDPVLFDALIECGGKVGVDVGAIMGNQRRETSDVET